MGLLIVALGLNKAQFICCISRFVTCFATFPHISVSEAAMGLFNILPIPHHHLSAHFKLPRVRTVFCFYLFIFFVFFSFLRLLEFHPTPSPLAFKLKIKSINQRQCEKDGETEGHLNPFRIPKASEGEINRKLKWSREWQQSFFFTRWKSRCISLTLPALYSDLMGNGIAFSLTFFLN